MSKPPFVNIYDIAGCVMLTVLICTPLWLLGSRSINTTTMLFLAVLFVGIVFIAKLGSRR